MARFFASPGAGRVLASPHVIAGGLIVAAVFLCALFAPWLAPHDPEDQNLIVRLLPPAWMAGGDPAYLFGSLDRKSVV